MKRQIITFKIIFLFIFFFLFCLPKSYASIASDDCGACHGLYPGMMEEGPAGEQKYVLQNTLCINCHSSVGSDTIKTLGGVRVPVINNTVKPVNPLAGGNFHYVAKGFGDRYGHNVDGIASPDAKFGNTPPGYDIETDTSVIGYSSTKPLTCAGSNGCHGNRKMANPSPAMDNFSAGCPGSFYRRDKIGKMSPWFRHPAGIVLPKSDAYRNYNPDVPPPADISGTRIYSLDAPVARDVVPSAPSEIVKPGTDIVFCLSCHVAHASQNESILRWNYDAIVSGETGGGCLLCHTDKSE